jgi:hypothetical protein
MSHERQELRKGVLTTSPCANCGQPCFDAWWVGMYPECDTCFEKWCLSNDIDAAGLRVMAFAMFRKGLAYDNVVTRTGLVESLLKEIETDAKQPGVAKARLNDIILVHSQLFPLSTAEAEEMLRDIENMPHDQYDEAAYAQDLKLMAQEEYEAEEQKRYDPRREAYVLLEQGWNYGAVQGATGLSMSEVEYISNVQLREIPFEEIDDPRRLVVAVDYERGSLRASAYGSNFLMKYSVQDDCATKHSLRNAVVVVLNKLIAKIEADKEF